MSKKIYVVFYKNSNNIEPVKEWLKSIDAKDRSKIGVQKARKAKGIKPNSVKPMSHYVPLWDLTH